MLRSLLIAFFALYIPLVAPSYAHDFWQNGDPVPAWIKKACCGPDDVHHLTPEQVHKVEGGYRIDGYPDMIPNSEVLPSEDGEYWAFYRSSTSDGTPWFSKIYCFFIPMST